MVEVWGKSRRLIQHHSLKWWIYVSRACLLPIGICLGGMFCLMKWKLRKTFVNVEFFDASKKRNTFNFVRKISVNLWNSFRKCGFFSQKCQWLHSSILHLRSADKYCETKLSGCLDYFAILFFRKVFKLKVNDQVRGVWQQASWHLGCKPQISK